MHQAMNDEIAVFRLGQIRPTGTDCKESNL